PESGALGPRVPGGAVVWRHHRDWPAVRQRLARRIRPVGRSDSKWQMRRLRSRRRIVTQAGAPPTAPHLHNAVGGRRSAPLFRYLHLQQCLLDAVRAWAYTQGMRSTRTLVAMVALLMAAQPTVAADTAGVIVRD